MMNGQPCYAASTSANPTFAIDITNACKMNPWPMQTMQTM